MYLGNCPSRHSPTVSTDEPNIHSRFYADRVLDKNGLWTTAVLADRYAARPAPTEWTSGEGFVEIIKRVSTELITGAVGLATNAWRSIVNTAQEVKEYAFDVAGKLYRVVVDATNTVIRKSEEILITSITVVGDTATAIFNAGASNISAIGNSVLIFLRLKESSPVMVGRELTVPVGASSLSFDFDFLNLGDGDWLTVFFEDRLLWSFTGTDFFGDEMRAVIDISEFAGQSGMFYFTLNSVGDRNADLLISNIEFSSYIAAGAEVPEPSSSALVLAALVMLLARVCGRRKISKHGQG